MFTAQELLGKIKNDKSKSDSDKLSDIYRASMGGLWVGAILGAYIGYTRRYNIMLTTFIGGATGALLTKTLLKPKKKDE